MIGKETDINTQKDEVIVWLKMLIYQIENANSVESFKFDILTETQEVPTQHFSRTVPTGWDTIMFSVRLRNY